jgi:hypothetical protein
MQFQLTTPPNKPFPADATGSPFFEVDFGTLRSIYSEGSAAAEPRYVERAAHSESGHPPIANDFNRKERLPFLFTPRLHFVGAH